MKISVITVSFNSASTIQSTLDSVAAQLFSDLEYIIVDGASADRTMDIVGGYSELVTHCICESDQGIYDAMNKGVRRATGDIIGVLNSDDFYVHGNVLREVAEVFAADPELEVVMGGVDFVQEDDLNTTVRTFRSGRFQPWMFRFGLMPPHPAVFVRKSAYERVGLYKLVYTIAADFDFLTRLLFLDGAKYKLVHKNWVRMRTGGASTRGLKSVKVISQEMRRSLQENGLWSCTPMLLCRLPFKLISQVFCK